MYKCNKCDEVCEKETFWDSRILKKYEADNHFKCDKCNFSSAGLVTLRKHVNTKHPHAVNPMNEARNESLQKYDNKNYYKPVDSGTLQCESPVMCELIGCCWCKYQG